MERGGRPPYDFQVGRSDRSKRSYSQMETAHRSSTSPLFVRQDSVDSDQHHPPPFQLSLPPLRHFPNDGYDFRRPVSSTTPTAANNVIDLTSDDESAPSTTRPTPHPEPAPGPARLPRYTREIIDLSAEAVSPVQTRQPRRLSSPEVQFVSERPRSRTSSRPPQNDPFFHPEYRHAVDDLTLDQDGDIMIQGSRSAVNRQGPRVVHRRFDMGMGSVAMFVAAARNRIAGLPFGMSYDTVAFDLGYSDEPPNIPAPKYEPPPPAPPGFTRDPTEEDTIVCPRCGDELAVGESEEKRQVWVVKACGHVYCGTCINSRKGKGTKNTNAKGKGRADDPNSLGPFTVCKVEGCGVTQKASGTRVSHKTDVMQVFL